MYDSRLIWREPLSLCLLMPSVLCIGGFGELGELDYLLTKLCFYRLDILWVRFYLSNSYASALLAVVIMSVRPSVRHTPALWQNQTMHCRYFDTTQKGNHSSFLTSTVVGGRRKLRLRQISAYKYNVSTVRDSDKSSIMTNRKSITGFPASYRWTAYVTPKSPKGWLKKWFKK